MLSTTEIKSPSPNQMKTLTLKDLATMNKLSVSLREQIKKHSNRVISILATKKEIMTQLPWDSILDNSLIRVPISKTEARALKYELMPKDTNNFYPFRQSTKIVGYIMFAFEICGLHQ